MGEVAHICMSPSKQSLGQGRRSSKTISNSCSHHTAISFVRTRQMYCTYTIEINYIDSNKAICYCNGWINVV